MALVTCPECEEQFVSRSRSPVCPACGVDIEEARSRAADEDDRPSRRRRDDEDDYDDRPRRRRKPAGGSAVLLLVLGLVIGLPVLLALAGVGFFLLGRPKPQAQAPPPPAFNPPPPPPAFGPPAGRPGMAPAAGGPAVTLSNLRRERGFGARDDIVVEVEFTSGSLDSFRDVLMVKSANGTTTEVMLHGAFGRNRETIRWNAGFGQTGRIEVWMERKDRPGMMGQGTKISNTVTLN